jgi:hypothetical protein
MSHHQTCVILVPYDIQEIDSLVDVLNKSAPQNYELSKIGEYPIAVLNLNQTTGTNHN